MLGDFRAFDSSKEVFCEPLRSNPFNFQFAIDDLTLIASDENVYDGHFREIIFIIENVVNTNKTVGPLYSAAFFCKLLDAVRHEFNKEYKKYKMKMPENIDELVGDRPYPGDKRL